MTATLNHFAENKSYSNSYIQIYFAWSHLIKEYRYNFTTKDIIKIDLILIFISHTG